MVGADAESNREEKLSVNLIQLRPCGHSQVLRLAIDGELQMV
jgi:hypothetical protein